MLTPARLTLHSLEAISVPTLGIPTHARRTSRRSRQGLDRTSGHCRAAPWSGPAARRAEPTRFRKQSGAKTGLRFSDHPESLKSVNKVGDMGRSLDEVIASLPRDQQEQIEARYDELRHEVDGLRELRQIAGKGQADVASALNIKQPSVSKIEKQTDMYLSTLRSYVEAVGGKLELTVKLPKRPALRIHHLGDQTAAAVAKPRGASRDAPSPARRHG